MCGVSADSTHQRQALPNQHVFVFPLQSIIGFLNTRAHGPSGNTRCSTTLVAHNCQFEHRFGRCMCGDLAVADFARPRTQFVCVCFSVAHWPPSHSRIADSNLTCFGSSPSFSQVSGCVCLSPVVTFATSFVTVRKYVGPSKKKKTSRCGRRLSFLQVSLVVHHKHDLLYFHSGLWFLWQGKVFLVRQHGGHCARHHNFCFFGCHWFCFCAVLSERTRSLAVFFFFACRFVL